MPARMASTRARWPGVEPSIVQKREIVKHLHPRSSMVVGDDEVATEGAGFGHYGGGDVKTQHYPRALARGDGLRGDLPPRVVPGFLKRTGGVFLHSLYNGCNCHYSFSLRSSLI